MENIDSVINSHYGMITSAQATEIASKNNSLLSKEHIDVQGINDFLKMQTHQSSLLKDSKGGNYNVIIEDKIYRIFEDFDNIDDNKKKNKRTIILGREGNTIALKLSEKFSKIIDINGFERGDIISARNVLLDIIHNELIAIPTTVLTRIFPSDSGIKNYDELIDGMKNIDVIGNIIEIGPIRYVNKINSNDLIGISSCVISNTYKTFNVSLWGRAALKTAAMNGNDTIKIEFCAIKKRNNTLEIYANDLSRILINKNLSSRLI